MKLVKKLIYFSLCLATILLLQTFESHDQYLDVATYKTELCVDFFQTSDAQLVTQDERDKADAILTSLYDEGIRTDITSAVNDQSVSMDIVTKILKYIVPWAVFLIISLIGWMFYCCYCVCDKKCPPSKCCKRDFNENKLKKNELYIPVGFAIVLNLLLGGAAIAGLVNAGDVERGMKAARCSLMALFSDIIYSTAGQDFPGLKGLSDNIKKISDQLTQFQSDLKTTFSDGTSSKIKTKKGAVITANDNMKRAGSNAAIPVNDNAAETYLSSNNYLDYILMSSTDSSAQTYTGKYQALGSDYKPYLTCTPQPEALAAYYDGMVTTAEQMETYSASISGGSFDSGAITSGSTTINSFIADIESAGKSLYDTTKPLDTYGQYASLALNVLFGVGLGLSVVSLISITLIILLKMYQLRGLLHFSWCIYIILMILCFLLALLLHPSSVLFAEVCHYLNQFMSDYKFFSDAKFINTGQTKDIIASCFFPSNAQSLYKVMKLDTATEPLNSFTAQVDAFKKQFATFDTQKADFQTKLNNNLLAVQNCKEGTVFDVQPSDYAPFSTAFTKFNSFKSNAGCVELAVQTCADSKKPMKSSADTGTDFNQNCWHPAYLATSSPTCSDQSSLPETAVLKAQYSKQSNLWASAYTKEKNVLTLNNDASATFEAYMGNINTFTTQASTIITSLDALLKGVNCAFLKQSFQNVLDGLCVIFIPGISRTTILIIIIAISMFFGSLANCCVGLRSYRIKEFGFQGESSSKIQPQNGDQELVAITKQP